MKATCFGFLPKAIFRLLLGGDSWYTIYNVFKYEISCI